MNSATPTTAIEAAFNDGLAISEPTAAADLLDRAAEANRRTPGRSGSVIALPAEGRLVMTGDLHDQPRNLQRILHYAELHRDPKQYLAIHEIIHGSSLVNGQDLSIRTLIRVAALKVAFPEQVLLLQSNHELAQLNGESIIKSGMNVVNTFDAGLDFLYGDDADQVRDAFGRYVRSLPLAIRCANGTMACHSLPAPRHIETFDKAILDREPTEADLAPTGDANRMVWGRYHNQKIADELAAAWGCNRFVMGHQPAEMGYETEGESMLILASDHERGVLLPIDLARSSTRDELIEQVVPLGAITVSK